MIPNVLIVEWGPFEDWKLINGSGTMTIRITSSALFSFSYILVSAFTSSCAFSLHSAKSFAMGMLAHGDLGKDKMLPHWTWERPGVAYSAATLKDHCTCWAHYTSFVCWNLVKHGVIQLSWRYTEVTFVQIFNPERVHNILATKRILFSWRCKMLLWVPSNILCTENSHMLLGL